MKKINTIAVLTVACGMLVGTLPAFAQTIGGAAGLSISASSSAGGAGLKITAQANIIVHAKNRADQEITRRIDALNALSARVDAMQKLSSGEKSGLSATIQSQIGTMASLQAKIDADTETSTLKADIQSIAKEYRIFMLIIPQGAIEAAADRVLAIVDTATSLGAKLQARISSAQSAGQNVSAAVSAYADFQAKVADANTQANAAVSETASLQPDNGVQTVRQANLTAMKDARAKVHAAQQDIVAARKDAETIVKVIMTIEKASGSASTSASASENASATANP
ncbi:MAG TPA: hypothetical protein VNG29_03955 [Candidatus Paceibacterota bacterium]|nr:hypothetical protein [Candidatus Paceibacterota bacterium]